MKILIDECLPEDLKKEFIGHVIFTVSDLGWNSMSYGTLLGAAIDNEFEAFVKIDKNLQYQQNLKKYSLIIIVLNSFRNDLESLKPIVPKVLESIDSLEKGQAYQFSI